MAVILLSASEKSRTYTFCYIKHLGSGRAARRGLAHSPAPSHPAQVLLSGFQGITSREWALSWLPHSPSCLYSPGEPLCRWSFVLFHANNLRQEVPAAHSPESSIPLMVTAII